MAVALRSCLQRGHERSRVALGRVRDKALLLERLHGLAKAMSHSASAAALEDGLGNGGDDDRWADELVPLLPGDGDDAVLGGEGGQPRPAAATAASSGRQRPLPLVRVLRAVLRSSQGFLLHVEAEVTNLAATTSLESVSLGFTSRHSVALQSQCHCLRRLGPGRSAVLSARVVLPPETALLAGGGHGSVLLQGSRLELGGGGSGRAANSAALEASLVLGWRWALDGDGVSSHLGGEAQNEAQYLDGGAVSVPHGVLLELSSMPSSWTVRCAAASSLRAARSSALSSVCPSADMWCARRWQLPLFLRSRTTDLSSLRRVLRGVLQPTVRGASSWREGLAIPQAVVVRAARHSAECTVCAASPLRLRVLLDALAASLPDDVSVALNSAQRHSLERVSRSLGALREEVRFTTKPLLFARRGARGAEVAPSPQTLWWLAFLAAQRRSDFALAEIVA